MKKLLIATLAVLMVFTSTACGDKEKNSDEGGKATTEAADSGEKDSKDETDPDNKEGNSDAEQSKDPVEVIVGESGIGIPKIDTFTVADTDICKITVTGAKDSPVGPTLTMDLENKTEDCEYVFSIKDSYVDSVFTPMYLNEIVPAGQKISKEISLSVSDLQKYGLTEITDIEFSIDVKDINASWIDPPEVEEIVKITPNGEDNAKKFIVSDDLIQNVYIDNKYAKVSALSYYLNETYGYCIDIFIENRSERNISVKFQDTLVNDKSLDPYVNEIINQGKSTIARVDWPVSDFTENNITAFEKVQFTLVVSDADDVSQKSFSSDEIVLKFGAQ